MCDCECPERRWGSTGHEIGSCELHHAADSSLRDAVQLLNVWGASRSMYPALCKQFSELSWQELTCVVAVDGSHDTRGCVTAGVEESER
eukprot:6210093-Pleurochrysis_carterae.AAC.2